MAQGDWESDPLDQEWLPDVDVRAVVAGLPSGMVSLDDFSCVDAIHCDSSLLEIRDAIQGLLVHDVSVAEKSLARLRWLVCSNGNTSVLGPFVVSSLIRIAENTGFPFRVEVLQLVGDLARMDTLRLEMRPWMLRTMQPMPVYDSSGYLENWAVEAVRMMVGRDVDLLITQLADNDPQVRGRVAYVLITGLPVRQDVVRILETRLAVETDPAVQMILVICIAQYQREQNMIPDALAWAETQWSDSTLPIGIRIGGAIAWLNLTTETVPPGLQRLRKTTPMSTIHELLQQLPWIWWLNYRVDGLAAWWRGLEHAEID